MAEFVEDDIIGEDLNYEEYDLDDDEEEALLAPNEGRSFSSDGSIHISVNENDVDYSPTTITEHPINYQDEEDDAIIEEEEDDDDYDSKSRDRFKSERTKVSLTKPSKMRNIPDSLDDVATTEVIQGIQKKLLNRRPKFQHRPNRYNNEGVHPYQYDGYHNINSFSNWEGSPMLNISPPVQMQPHFRPIIGMHPMHGHTIRLPPSAYGLMPGHMNPYMNVPQIPQMPYKHPFNSMPTDAQHNKSRAINKSSDENTRNVSNLTVISTVDIPKAKPSLKKQTSLKVLKKVEEEKPVIADKNNISMDEAEYQRKVEEQMKKREEILAKKEMRRKEAARKAQANAIQTTSTVSRTPQKVPSEKKSGPEISAPKRVKRMRIMEGFHDKSPVSDNTINARIGTRSYQESQSKRPMIREQQPFSLRNLAGPAMNNAPYNPPINTSVPPPRLVPQQSAGYLQSLQLVNRQPPGSFILPPNLPPQQASVQHQPPPFARNSIPNQPLPVSVPHHLYPPPAMNPVRLRPNVPPHMTTQYEYTRPPLRTVVESPTIKLNFPPPPISRPSMHMPDFYEKRSSPSRYEISSPTRYDNSAYENDGISRPIEDLYPEYSPEQGVSFAQKYKWKGQGLNQTERKSTSHIPFNRSPNFEAPRQNKVKKFKRIIRKNRNGDILLIKKLVLDEDGNPTGVEEIEFMHEDIIAETSSMKKLKAEKLKRLELLQQTANISNKHFSGSEDLPTNIMGEEVRQPVYSRLETSKLQKRLKIIVNKGRSVRPVRCSSTTVTLFKIPSNVTVHELKDLVYDLGFESPKSMLYDKTERKCSFEFADQENAFKFCKTMNGRMMKMSVIHARIV